MKFALALALLALPFARPALADDAPASIAPVAGFYAALAGNWAGSGSVVMHIGQQGTFPVGATLAAQVVDANTWHVLNKVTGQHGAGTNDNTFTWDGNQLNFSGQFNSPVKLIAVDDSEISFQISHTDNVTGARVLLARIMTLTDANTLAVTSDVYQNGTLVEHFAYTMKRQ